MKKVTIYTDGACSVNPGIGGWAAVLIYNGVKKEVSGYDKNTTNNRMELRGVIAGLEALKMPCAVSIWTDSQYVVRAFNDHWIEGWQKRHWKNASKKPVKNKDLWERLLLVGAPHRLTFHWVEGHAGHPENERCDELAVRAALSGPAQIDEGFEGLEATSKR